MGSSSGVSDQQSWSSSPGLDTVSLKAKHSTTIALESVSLDTFLCCVCGHDEL